MSTRAPGELLSTSGSKYAAKHLSADELLNALGETTPALLWLGDAQGKCVFLNAAQREFWGVDPADLAAFDWTSTLHPDDVDKLAGPFMAAMAAQQPFTVEARYRRADGVWRVLRTAANPRFDADGAFLGMTGVNTDVTDRLEAEARNRYIMGELNHRVKNVLMVVQSLARQSARNANAEDFIQNLLDRIHSLAASNDLLLKSEWKGVCMSELADVQKQLLPEESAARFSAGGAYMAIGPSEAPTLGMALHELTTNSLKYGALADPEGRVELSWDWQDAQSGSWQLEWREAVTRPVTPPQHKGFGHSVLVDMIAGGLNAEVSLTYPPTGLVYRVTARKGATGAEHA